ncbi:MAG: DUF3341 domain-containing protein [Caulobacteraceae bacterium]|nr:DUF3341 domain-containing protein [Caulobacter sp.]
MSDEALLAGFPAADRLLAAARAEHAAGRPALDAFTPYPVEGLDEAFPIPARPMPWVMGACGLGVFAFVYLLEWGSARFGYTFNTGGRPLNAWPTFIIPAFEFAILGAALGGFVALLFWCRLPRLNHPLFDRLAFERASQDQFVLAVPLPPQAEAAAVRDRLYAAGAVWIEEARL